MDHSPFPFRLFRSWPPARRHLQGRGLDSALVDHLVAVTLDRACLLAELPASALALVLGEGPGSPRHSALLAAQESALRAHPPPWPSDRYLPTPPQAAAASSLRWQERVRLSKPPQFLWIEVLAAGGLMSAASLNVAIENVFEEWKFSSLLGTSTFEQRCLASDCQALVPRFCLDEKAASRPLWTATPRQRIAALQRGLTPYGGGRPSQAPSPPEGRLPSQWRFPGLLAREAGLRTQLASVRGSWRCLRSGLAAWDFHVENFARFENPFSVTEPLLASYSAMFMNGDTFKAYLGHLSVGCRLVGRPLLPSALSSALIRGARKFVQKSERPTLRSAAVLALVRRAVREGLTDLARIMTIARQFLSRVADETFPLQLDGRQGLGSDDLQWHSQVVLGASSAIVILRTRKNEPRGARLTRKCVCASQHPLLCGVCSLRAAVAESTAQGRDPRQRLFTLQPAAALADLRRLSAFLDLGRPGWHAFRRGMAQDMLDGGSSLSQILQAGGWRSSAFLRYLIKHDVDAREAAEFAIADSDSDPS